MRANEVEFHQDVAILKLTQGKHAVVDIADYPVVSGYRWHAIKMPRRYYASTHIRTNDGKQTLLQIHRLLLPDAAEVDHIDHDGLNNTRGNIRACTHAQNHMNQRKSENCTSQYKGVCRHKATQKWQSQITLNRVPVYIGRFATELDAAHAYDASARKHFGEFACLNFPEPVAGDACVQLSTGCR